MAESFVDISLDGAGSPEAQQFSQAIAEEAAKWDDDEPVVSTAPQLPKLSAHVEAFDADLRRQIDEARRKAGDLGSYVIFGLVDEAPKPSDQLDS